MIFKSHKSGCSCNTTATCTVVHENDGIGIAAQIFNNSSREKRKQSHGIALCVQCIDIYIFQVKIVYTVYFVAYQKAAVQCVKCGVKAVMREL